MLEGVDRVEDSLHSVDDELSIDRRSSNFFMREAIACVRADVSLSRSDSGY